ncbi:MotA/TolQ/ExbB proton channel family protein [Limisphaera ngatamarikiensis]|uniref:MotA/TolQ/ExbB proton channel family protein n=1 Tax=Limisphaera ngatamarikiensis TaxID=1324935 RepID=A0A6M1S1P1_9BACT|nr:MotA/TolQ/ExbB proton channel family protein [Limisphaera ngatamarikiensis]NGO39310.1 MotA/TolQ/ExbB proton channel family protein [Limisphaera ngatamarikiensis]
METLVYVLLVLTSLVSLTFIIERGVALRWRKVVPPEVEAAVESCQGREDVPMLRRVCEQHPSPLSRLLLLAMEHLAGPKEEAVSALETRARHEVVRLERGLVVLEVAVGVAPLLGLVGTIVGMISLFANIGQAGLGDAARLAQGIALILNATLLGLLIAIPSLIAWSYFNRKVETLAVEMEAICDEFLRRQYRAAECGATASPEGRAGAGMSARAAVRRV